MKGRSYEHFFFRFVMPHFSSLIFIFALSILGMLFAFLSPLLTKSLVDDVFIGKRDDLLGYILLGTAGIYIVSSISDYLSSYLRGKLDLIIFKDVAEETFNAVQLGSLRKTQEMKIGDLLSRIMGNTRSAVYISTYIIPEFAMNALRIIGPFFIMLFLNPQLALIVMIPVLFISLSSSFFGNRLERKQKASLVRIASLYSLLKENLSMIPLIKVFGLEMWSRNKFCEQLNDYCDISLDCTKNSSLTTSIGTLIYGMPVILLILFGGPMVIQGSLSLGTFTAFMSYVALFFSPLSQLSYLWTSYKSSAPSFDRVNEIFQLEQDSNGNKRLIVSDGIIRFDNVWFSYDNKYILKGFNATFAKGLNYIVGDNGTGKSTILKLLCTLYPVDKGHITIDGHEITDIKRNDLRKNISMIFSDPYLFDGSIYENIHIGDLAASREEVIHAARLVCAHEFISSSPKGYETNIGENGLKLSSGEKQKIALARAILKNSPIILLDEVTKSIDAESRKLFDDVLMRLKNDKTIIIITHNLSDIRSNSNVVHIEFGHFKIDSSI